MAALDSLCFQTPAYGMYWHTGVAASFLPRLRCRTKPGLPDSGRSSRPSVQDQDQDSSLRLGGDALPRGQLYIANGGARSRRRPRLRCRTKSWPPRGLKYYICCTFEACVTPCLRSQLEDFGTGPSPRQLVVGSGTLPTLAALGLRYRTKPKTARRRIRVFATFLPPPNI